MARPRQANGTGGVTSRKDGSWMARYTVQTPSGRKRRVIYAKSREGARRKLAEAIADRDRGLVYDSEGLTVEEYLGRWLEDSVRGSVRPYTHQTYESLVRLHVNPALGATKLKDLAPAQVQALYRRKLDEGLAPKTVKYVHTTLHRALKQAVRWGLLPATSRRPSTRLRRARRRSRPSPPPRPAPCWKLPGATGWRRSTSSP